MFKSLDSVRKKYFILLTKAAFYLFKNRKEKKNNTVILGNIIKNDYHLKQLFYILIYFEM